MSVPSDFYISTTTQSVEVGDPLPIRIGSNDSLLQQTDILGVFAENAHGGTSTFYTIQNGQTALDDSTFTVLTMPFDTGSWSLKGVVFGDSAQVIARQPALVRVSYMSIDTSESIKDIHAPVEGEFNILHYWPEGLALLLAVVGVVFGALYLRKRPQPETKVEPAKAVDPTKQAFNRLNAVKQENMAAAGQPKYFYSEVTNILREYIELAFEIQALEQTSAELLAAVRHHPAFQERSLLQLQKLCEVADAVKFAKHHTTTEVNEQQLQSAYSIVLALSEYVQHRANTSETTHD